MSATMGKLGRVDGKLNDGTSPKVGLNPYSSRPEGGYRYTDRHVCHITSITCSLDANLVIQLENKSVQYEAVNDTDWAHTNASPARTLWGGANRRAGLCLGSSSPTEISEPAKLSTTLYLQRTTICESREKLDTSSARWRDRTGINLKFKK